MSAMPIKRHILCFIFLLYWCILPVIAQDQVIISGSVIDENSEPLSGAVISDIYEQKPTVSDQDGVFQISVIPNREVILVCTFLGYRNDTTRLMLQPGETKILTIRMIPSPEMLGEVLVKSRFDRAESLQQINIRSIDHIPLPSGSFESILSTLGASSRNEMSSAYSVRGGNLR
jgi:hypothetical protein